MPLIGPAPSLVASSEPLAGTLPGITDPRDATAPADGLLGLEGLFALALAGAMPEVAADPATTQTPGLPTDLPAVAPLAPAVPQTLASTPWPTWLPGDALAVPPHADLSLKQVALPPAVEAHAVTLSTVLDPAPAAVDLPVDPWQAPVPPAEHPALIAEAPVATPRLPLPSTAPSEPALSDPLEADLAATLAPSHLPIPVPRQPQGRPTTIDTTEAAPEATPVDEVPVVSTPPILTPAPGPALDPHAGPTPSAARAALDEAAFDHAPATLPPPTPQEASAPAGSTVGERPIARDGAPSTLPAPPVPAPSAPALPTPVERALAHQVLRAARDRGPDRHLVIRLTPPELGTVRIEFHHEGTALQVVLQAEDPAVRRALEQAIPHLRQELSRHEGSTIAVTVGSQADHPAGQGERNPQDRSQGRDQGSPGSRRGPRFDLERLASLGPAVATRSGGVGLARVDTQA